ncbi:MAG: nodulation protein NfeD [Anaerolineales bacterium]|nr:nodulation protein NfeD [Anaerolineales bacterium]
MRKTYRILLLCFMIIVLFPALGHAQTTESGLVLRIEGVLTPTMAEYLERGIERARSDEMVLIILELDTPGGSVDVMNRMIKAIRSSEIPVVVYISPRGAAAGSAGTVVTLAGHAAAMAPETVIGAASPVGSQGEDLGETLEAKTVEILKATVRTLSERRGETAVRLAEETIEFARAVSAEEALGAGIVDIIASDLDDLLSQLDGFSFWMPAGVQTIHTDDLMLVSLEQSPIERLLQVLTNPNVTFILLTIGVQALLIELSHPGGWVAGFLGVVCLALGAYGLGILPVNWFGLVFMLTSFVLFFLDIKAPTHGALTVAGLAAFIVGSLVLFNSPGTPWFQRVSIPLVLGTGVTTAAFFLTIVAFAIRAQLRPVRMGMEVMPGRIGITKTELNPDGMVQMDGELWSAETAPGSDLIAAGERVEVIGSEGLRLKVRPIKQDG